MTRPSPSAIAETIFRQHLHMAATDGRVFRRTVMDQIMAESGCTDSSAATQYNNVKKRLVNEIPATLGRQTRPATVTPPLEPEISGVIRHVNPRESEDAGFGQDCWSVVELVGSPASPTVGRTRSYQTQGDASEDFDSSRNRWASSTWVLIQGLGPLSGTPYRLEEGEREINRWNGSSSRETTHEYTFSTEVGSRRVRAGGRTEAELIIGEDTHDFQLTHIDGQPVDADF